jgi:Flp pilus assembly protein TadB
VLLDHPSLIAATLTLMGLGVVWMKRILNFDM